MWFLEMYMIHIPQSDKSTVKYPSQDEALARQFHPRLEKQTLIEQRFSGHLWVLKQSSKNKHWRAKKEFFKLLQKLLLLSRESRVTCGSSNPPLKTNTGEQGRERIILWGIAKNFVVNL